MAAAAAAGVGADGGAGSDPLFMMDGVAAPTPKLLPPPLKPSGSKFTSVNTISFAEDMNPKYRSTMEDSSTVVDGFSGDAATGLFAIFDGHGGRAVADYLSAHLHVELEKELQDKGDRSVEECMRTVFMRTDKDAFMTREAASGSTAVVCLVRKLGLKRYVFTANCGDARAVLCHAGIAVRLSKDHKATDAAEKERIEKAGGFVIRKRVMGVLAVARSFGDFGLKAYVTADPYTSTTKLDASSEFIVMACDGVWDVLEDQVVVDLVKSHLASGGGGGGGSGAGGAAGSASASKIKSVAQVVVDEALAHGSSDNITVIVIFL